MSRFRYATLDMTDNKGQAGTLIDMAERFRDRGETIYTFMGEILVICPRCAGCALTRPETPADSGCFTPRRLTCAHCGYSATWAERTITRGWREAKDDYFQLPLWLQTPCCGHILWAYNAAHLQFIEDFVQAKLRSRSPDPETGWSNRSLASRLPHWVGAAKNRSDVLKGVARLRDRIADCL